MNPSSTNHPKQISATFQAEFGLLCAPTPNTAESEAENLLELSGNPSAPGHMPKRPPRKISGQSSKGQTNGKKLRIENA